MAEQNFNENDDNNITTNQKQSEEPNEFDDLSAWNGDKIAEILNAAGPTVKAVLLKTDGTSMEVDYDSTPKANKVTEILGSAPSIIGQYADLDVIVVGSRWDTDKDKETLGLNQHKLRYPFNNDQFYGNIFLYKFSQDCVVQNFTLNEYNEFASKLAEDADKVWELPTECVNEQAAFDNDENVDNAVDDDFDEEAMAGYFREVAKQKVRKDFPAKFGREPTEEELEQFAELSMRAMMGMLGGNVGGDGDDGDNENDDDDDDDEEYNPDDDAEQEMLDAEEDVVHEQSVVNEVDEVDETEVLDEAMGGLTIVNDDDDKEDNDLVDENGEEITAEQFQEEYRNAMGIARMIGKVDSKCLINSICDTYNEINGAEPSIDQLHGIIGRVICQFSEEQSESNNSNGNEEVNDDVTSAVNDVVCEKNEDEKYEIMTNEVKVKVLTTPVKKNGQSSRVDIYFENAKASSLESATSQFEKINKKAPNEDDTKRLKDFLETGMLFEDVVATKVPFDVNGGGDDEEADSDYDPKKDEFDYSKDKKDEEDFVNLLQKDLLNKENELDNSNVVV